MPVDEDTIKRINREALAAAKAAAGGSFKWDPKFMFKMSAKYYIAVALAGVGVYYATKWLALKQGWTFFMKEDSASGMYVFDPVKTGIFSAIVVVAIPYALRWFM